jgi:hypothetical protein
MPVPRERIKALEWFAQFANMDLAELSPGDRAKFLVDCEEYLFQSGLKKDYYKSGGITPPLKIQRLFGSPDSPVFWRNIRKLQIVLRKEIKWFLYQPSKYGHLMAFPWKGKLQINFWREQKSPCRLIFIPFAGNHRDLLFIRLFTLLEGLPPFTIRKCLICEKYFINASWKEKNFCSTRCMWRFNARKWREELKKDPKKRQAYLKKQREIMNKRYEEKQKALGYKKVSHYKKRIRKEK